MNLSAPSVIPDHLESRYRAVATRLAGLDIALPDALGDSAGRVLCASSFVLDMLLRQPDALLARLEDPAPVTRMAIEASLDLGGTSAYCETRAGAA